MITDRQVSPSATFGQLNSSTRILHDRAVATGDQTCFGGSLALVQRRRIRNSFAVLHRVSESFSPVGSAKVAALGRQSLVFLSVRSGRDCSDAIATVQRCPAKCVLAVFQISVTVHSRGKGKVDSLDVDEVQCHEHVNAKGGR
jgi:hypothetical protein